MIIGERLWQIGLTARIDRRPKTESPLQAGCTRVLGMVEIRTVTTLRSERTENLSSIGQYEKRIAQACAELSVRRQCALMGVARSGLYRPKPVPVQLSTLNVWSLPIRLSPTYAICSVVAKLMLTAC